MRNKSKRTVLQKSEAQVAKVLTILADPTNPNYDVDVHQYIIDHPNENVARTAIEDAKQGMLADALERYTDPNDPEYDPSFDKEIRKMAPYWFDEQREIDLWAIKQAEDYHAGYLMQSQIKKMESVDGWDWDIQKLKRDFDLKYKR